MKVGFWIPDKKWKKLNVALLEKLLSVHGHQMVRLDMDRSLDHQGPFGAIVHKVSDEIAKADEGDVAAQERIRAFESYIASHPDVAIFDPMRGVRILMHRKSERILVSQSDLVNQGLVYAPPFVELTSTDAKENTDALIRAGVHFPLVCKSLIAHGHGAHMMSLVFNESGMKDVRMPCIAQSFINHNARLYKLYVIREKYYVVERPSLKNFYPCDSPTIHFDTHTISKPDSSSVLTELDEEIIGERQEIPSQQTFDMIFREFRQKLGLSLFGIDVIIEKGSGRHAIIDINVFPGYDGVPRFLEDMSDMIADEIRRRGEAATVTESRTMIKAAKAKFRVDGGNEIDSGIDTSDSCDEKKPKAGSERVTMRSKIKSVF